MNENPENLKEAAPAPGPRLGLAIASLVLGILAVVLSVFVLGAFLGILGLCLGLVHIRRKHARNMMAWWGVWLSIAGIIFSVGFGVLYYQAYKKVAAIKAELRSNEVSVEQWDGALAPDINVKTLDGQTIELSKLRGKRVVLDFWATWCSPCVKEIPHFIRLFNETSRDQVTVLGISSEDESTLKPFVKKHAIGYLIASAKDLPSPYKDVQSIPTTFFIDRNGVIQSIAVGYHDFDALKQQALAEDRQGAPKPPPSPPVSQLKQSSELLTAVEAWTNSVANATALAVGDWDNDGSMEILVAAGKRLHVLSASGTLKTTIPLPEQFGLIEAGHHATGGVRLLGYSNWGHKVSVLDGTGREIWSYPASSGVDGAHWGDLDGDKTDELIVGMNGGGGLHAVSADGKKLWAVTDIGNVWNQAVIPAGKDRAAVVFATEAGGTVRVYDGKGKLQRVLRPQGKYCAQMTAKAINHEGIIQCLAVGDSTVIAFDEQGAVAWSTPAIKDHGAWRKTTFAGGDVNGDGNNDWVFHESTGELVIADWRGGKLASIPGQARVQDFAILPANKQSLLVTLSDSIVRAYKFEPAGAR